MDISTIDSKTACGVQSVQHAYWLFSKQGTTSFTSKKKGILKECLKLIAELSDPLSLVSGNAFSMEMCTDLVSCTSQRPSLQN